MEDGVQEMAEHTQRGGEYTNGALVGGVFLRNSGEGREKSLERWDEGVDCVAEDVGELVAALPEPLRRAVVLTKLRGMSCAAAARQEGVSDAAMRKRVSRAYKKLAKAYKKLEQQDGER